MVTPFYIKEEGGGGGGNHHLQHHHSAIHPPRLKTNVKNKWNTRLEWMMMGGLSSLKLLLSLPLVLLGVRGGGSSGSSSTVPPRQG